MNFAEFWDTWCDQQGNTGNDKDPQACARAGWDAGRVEPEQEIGRLKHLLSLIYDLACGWMMKESLEIVTAGGAGHAAPMGTICQLVNVGIESKDAQDKGKDADGEVKET